MAEESMFRGVIDFFGQVGIYDVVLPFLLVFTIVFAIFEKTKILGTEGKDGGSRKNLNAMVSFVVGFLVVASSKLVAVINQAMSQVVLLLLLTICFLLLIGAFYRQDEAVALEKGWRTLFMLIMFIGIVLIFLNALGWLKVVQDYLLQNWDTSTIGAVILVGVVVLFMVYILREPKTEKSSTESK